MKQNILRHTCLLIVVSVILTFLAASLVMYQKYNDDLKQSVRDDAVYIKDGIQKMGEQYLKDNPAICDEIAEKVREHYGLKADVTATTEKED